MIWIVLIIGRGGMRLKISGPLMKNVKVASISESRTSVGHETDTTLADFVTDRRAAISDGRCWVATPVTKLDLLSHLQAGKSHGSSDVQSLDYNREPTWPN